MRFLEDGPADLDRARAAVAAWRELNPLGSADQLVIDLAGRFRPECGPVLRALLLAADRHRARVTTGVPVAAREHR